jgi:hypothetical protein
MKTRLCAAQTITPFALAAAGLAAAAARELRPSPEVTERLLSRQEWTRLCGELEAMPNGLAPGRHCPHGDRGRI